MFFRIKPSGERRYLQIVENSRDGAATRQRVVATLGRVEDLEAAGKLDTLLRSGARLSETALLISGQQAGTLDASETARIDAPMIQTSSLMPGPPLRRPMPDGSRTRPPRCPACPHRRCA